jgi:hypothetical protein
MPFVVFTRFAALNLLNALVIKSMQALNIENTHAIREAAFDTYTALRSPPDTSASEGSELRQGRDKQ